METVIDWSKWPEDAEIFLPDQQGTSQCVVKFGENGSVFFAYSKNYGWTLWSGANRETLLERFKYASKAWNGDGWPPAGARCEMSLFAQNSWETCTPVYYLNQPDDHSDQVVVYQDSLGGDVCYILDPPCSGSIQFRPIRTQEQIAEEEAAKERAMKCIEWLKGIEEAYGEEVAEKCEDILKEADSRGRD